ncbi:MAG: glycosyltransferase family 1 protein [Bryobacterales bacterium]|nr:glycosyltransferase family 1 protein [Bryobacterales bacterium]
MRLLVLYQGRDAATDQPGYFHGYERLASEGMLEAHATLAYHGIAAARGWPAVWQEAESAARAMEADAICLQFFHGDSIPDPTAGIQRLRALPSKPLLFTTLGDGYGRILKRVPASFRRASALADVSFLSGMGYVARQLAASGSRNLVLIPNGCCQVRFAAPASATPDRPDFDVAFIGSLVRSSNPLSPYFWASRSRARFVDACERRYGSRFGLFGNGWQGRKCWQGPMPFTEQHRAYHRSALALGGIPHFSHDYYTSDRVFFAIASGVPFVDSWVRGVEHILEPDHDWWLARGLPDMFDICDRLLAMPAAERQALGDAARRTILARHTQYHRCAQMMEVVRSVRDARRKGRLAPPPVLPFVRTHGTTPAPPAVVAWQG